MIKTKSNSIVSLDYDEKIKFEQGNEVIESSATGSKEVGDE